MKSFYLIIAATFIICSRAGAQEYSILRSDRYACVLNSQGQKIDSLRIPKMTPDIRFASDSSIVASLHTFGDTLVSKDKGFMLVFYTVRNNKLEELHGYPVSVQDGEELKKLDIKLGQNSILINNGNMFSNTYKIPVRTCIKKTDLLKLIKLVGTK
jgi:hypothetical protein